MPLKRLRPPDIAASPAIEEVAPSAANVPAMGSLAQAEFIGSPGSTALSDGSAGAVGTDTSDPGWRSSSLDATFGASSEDCSGDMDRC